MSEVFLNFDDLTSSADGPLALFLLQCLIVLVMVRVFGFLVGYCHSPRVIGEILAGIFIGPSILGYIPGWTNTLFPLATISYFGLVANIGLILFLFYLGLELDEELLKKQWKKAVPIATAAMAVPFGIGAALSVWLYDLNSEDFHPVNRVAFILFCGIAMSITAFPVLAGILAGTKLITTPIGITAMSCSAIDDVTAWCLLAIATSFSKSNDPIQGLWTILLSIGFVALAFGIVRPLLARLYEHWQQNNPEPDLDKNKQFMFIVFIVLLCCSYASEEIGIHSFFGAFVAGLIVPKSGRIHTDMASAVDVLTREIFLPLYFAASGIKTNIGTLTTGYWWGVVIAVWLIASVAKFTPATLVAKIVTKRDWRFCITLGTLMNTRGLVELIALNVGLQAGVLSPRIFTILVIMALLTTFCTSPIVYLVYQKSYQPELEQNVQARIAEVREIPEAVVEEEKESDQQVVFHRDMLTGTETDLEMGAHRGSVKAFDKTKSFRGSSSNLKRQTQEEKPGAVAENSDGTFNQEGCNLNQTGDA